MTFSGHANGPCKISLDFGDVPDSGKTLTFDLPNIEVKRLLIIKQTLM